MKGGRKIKKNSEKPAFYGHQTKTIDSQWSKNYDFQGENSKIT